VASEHVCRKDFHSQRSALVRLVKAAVAAGLLNDAEDAVILAISSADVNTVTNVSQGFFRRIRIT
jgi:hypothetical protein